MSAELKLFQNSNLSFQKNELFFEKVNLREFSEQVKAPFYIYSASVIERNIKNFQNALEKFNINGKIFFAVKTNLNREIIKIIKNKKCGTDTTSIGEIEESLASGVKGENIVFSGVGKTEEELKFAIANNVQINTESLNEIILIDAISRKMNKITEISIRINPEIDGQTHKKISTGQKGDKFGVLMSDFNLFQDNVKNMKNIKLTGLSFHIGSQITDIKPFEMLFKKINNLYEIFKKNQFDIKKIDVGGGIGILYKETEEVFEIEEYIKALYDNLSSKLPPDIIYYFEPGRYIVANSGILMSKAIYIKKSGNEEFIILNIGMNNLIRPAIYDSYHEILSVTRRKGTKVYNIAGPICESSDFFAKNRKINIVEEGDFVAILGAGSCGQSMASMYNARDIIEEYLIENEKNIRKIRNRVSMKDIAAKFYNFK